MPTEFPQGRVTFQGRGLAFAHGARLVLKICPICSQWNAPRAADRGQCGWCAYTPSCSDVEPVPGTQDRETAT